MSLATAQPPASGAGVRPASVRAVAQAWKRAVAGFTRGAEAAASVLSRPRTEQLWLRSLGWWLLACCLVTWFVGFRYGWLELTVVSAVAGTLLATALLFVVGRSRYDVGLVLARRRVVVGERAVGRVLVTNASSRPLLPAEIELPVGAGLAGFPLPRLAAGASHEDVFTIPTSRRCVIVVGPIRSVRGDPLGIARREVRWTEPEELFVHPRTVPLTGASAGFLKDLEGRPTRDLSPSDISFHALREYVVGDDRRHVHWKTTARTGQLMVRQFEETRRSHLAVALSTNDADYGDPEEFELAVSVAGSLGLHAIKEERDLTVVIPGGLLRGGSATRLLDDLSRVVLEAQRDGVVAIAQSLGNDVPDASVAVLLFGARVTPSQLRMAAVRMPHEVRAIALRCVPGETLRRRAIGDLTVLTIGDLVDLPVGIRKAGD